ncbi:hypothetical protein ACWN8B_04850 [Vagococcus zengguangii]|uniref:hypothetical protein n=1 Tax=Vagococcus zengguangii TaxID=2571750 RepID=UPI001AEF6104|nr:hypothetical protein [Vagococcus zengguangii]
MKKTTFELVLTDNMTVLTPATPESIKQVSIYLDTVPSPQTHAVYLKLAGQQLVAIALADEVSQWTLANEAAIIEVSLGWEVEPSALQSYLIKQAQAAKLKAFKDVEVTPQLPANQVATTAQVVETLLEILQRIGYPLLVVKKAKPAKAQHRFTKDIAEIPFYVNSFDAQATVYWQKRNEMLIKAGAKLRQEMPLNKDGSIGLSAKMGQQLRSEHQDKIRDGQTIEDIVLKSVNEVGLFLYYGGTNGWLVLKDTTGKTIDEWTVVK